MASVEEVGVGAGEGGGLADRVLQALAGGAGSPVVGKRRAVRSPGDIAVSPQRA